MMAKKIVYVKEYKKSCKDCSYCNMKEFNRGRWYCSNPEVSVFIPVPAGLPCFKPRKDGDGK